MDRLHTHLPLVLCLSACAGLSAQQPAASTETGGRPYSIRQTWIVGGTGSWDYLTMDATSERLYIAHGHSVQAVDVTSGSVAGQITGLTDAHEVALDDTGEFGYISDGAGSQVVVFDRRSLQTVATIPAVPNPRALVFEPQSRLLFAVRTDLIPQPKPAAVPHITRRPVVRSVPVHEAAVDPKATSPITVIDTQTNKVIGQILLPGTLGYALADGRGQVFINVTDRNEIVRIDAQTVADLLPKLRDQAAADAAKTTPAATAKEPPPIPAVDWVNSPQRQVHTLRLSSECTTPKSLAIDPQHQRLFAACNNLHLAVLNADNGDEIATLPIGPGVDGVAYDAGRGLIYAANGGADGSLTIIRQHATDTYAVIQTLPTRQRARTLAVNSENGQVYLVTDLLGVDLASPAKVVTTDPVNGSFQVLVVGN